jgi:oxygen-dependent protoporphyrinogen oxidase
VPGARGLESVIYSPLDGAGFVAAWESDATIRACTYAWLKYPGRAPPGYALLRAFVGPMEGDPAALAHAELAAILGVTGSPLWSRAFHWVRSLPRYKPGHARHVAAVRQRLARLAPLDIAGAGFDGTSVSACVKSGREAAKRVLGRLAG